MQTIDTKLQLQVCKKKYKLIYFLQILKRFNISVDLTLAKYKILVKLNIRISKI